MAKRWHIRLTLTAAQDFIIECDNPDDAREIAEEAFTDHLDFDGMICDMQECEETTNEKIPEHSVFISV